MKSKILLYLLVMSVVFGLAANHAPAGDRVLSCRVHIVTNLDDSTIGNSLARAGASVDTGLVRFDNLESPQFLLEVIVPTGSSQTRSMLPSLYAGDLILMQVTRMVENQFQMNELKNILVGYRIAETCERNQVDKSVYERCALKEVSGIRAKLDSICTR